MHKAKKHFKFVRVLKIFAVFVFHYSEWKPECSYSSFPISHLWLITGRTNPVLNGADVARDFTRIAFGIVQNCSEWFGIVCLCRLFVKA